MADQCRACGSSPAQTWLGDEGPLCDGCFDERVSAATGWPRLPTPPNPLVVPGPDGRAVRLRVRLMRTPGGISADAVEERPDGDVDDGYELSVFGEHDADPFELLANLEQRVRAEIGRPYLERAEGGWQVAGLEVAGRVSYSDDGPPDVVVDGRRLGWDEFGQMIASFEGWWFRIHFGDDEPNPASKDAADPGNTGAVVVPLRSRRQRHRNARHSRIGHDNGWMA